jgi:hypothetical protein
MSDATIRASSMSRLLDCAHAWEGIHLLGMQSHTGGASWLGTSWHHASAAYDLNRADMLVSDAVGEFRDHLAKAEDVRWNDISPREALAIGTPLIVEYCEQWSPRFDFLAVEMKLEPQTITVDLARHRLGPVDITFTGSMDRARVVKRNGYASASIVDVKTGKRAVSDGQANTQGHAPQVAIYNLLANMDPSLPENVTGEPAILGVSTAGSKTKDARIAMSEIPDAMEQLVGTTTSPGLIEYAAVYLKTGLFPPNPKSQLCSETYCPRWERCKFK